MADTLTRDEELTRVAVADIEKWEDGPDGTLYVYGKASTPEIDTDEQIVASEFSGPALKTWLDTAPALRVQHNGQRDPAGSGVKVEINRDGDGAHWVKAAVDEPIAQRLVKKGHLRAFSIGISRPVIERDISGKARGGKITGGSIMEVSLVDSPANRSCFLELAKAASDGTAELTGKVFGADDFLAKAAAPDDGGITGTVTFTPADMAKLLKLRAELEKGSNGNGAAAADDDDSDDGSDSSNDGGSADGKDDSDDDNSADGGDDDGADDADDEDNDADKAVAEPDAVKGDLSSKERDALPARRSPTSTPRAASTCPSTTKGM